MSPVKVVGYHRRPYHLQQKNFSWTRSEREYTVSSFDAGIVEEGVPDILRTGSLPPRQFPSNF